MIPLLESRTRRGALVACPHRTSAVTCSQTRDRRSEFDRVVSSPDRVRPAEGTPRSNEFTIPRPSKKRAADRRRRQRASRREARGAASCWHIAVVPHDDHPWGIAHTIAVLGGDGRCMQTWTGPRALLGRPIDDLLRRVRSIRGVPHEVYATDPTAVSVARASSATAPMRERTIRSPSPGLRSTAHSLDVATALGGRNP